MPAEYTYDYAIIRVVPRVDRGESMNAGVILSCPELGFLEARVALDVTKLCALDPAADVDTTRDHLDRFRESAEAAPTRGRSPTSRSAGDSTGSSRRAAPSSRCRRCTPAGPPIHRPRSRG